MSDQKASFAMGTAENFVQSAQQYVDAVSTMSQRGQQIAGAFNNSLGQVSAYIERLQAQFPSGDKTAQNAKGNDANNVISRMLGQTDTFVKGMSEKVDVASNMLGQADGFVKGLSQKVGVASTVIDEVSTAVNETKEFSSAAVATWKAISSNKSKTSGEYWSGLVDSVKSLFKEGQDVVTSVGAVVDTVSGKALDKGQEAKKSTVSTSPLSKDVSNMKAQKKRAKGNKAPKGSDKKRHAGGANNKGGSAATKVQRVFVVNMPKSGAFAVQRDQTNNTSEPSWLDQVKSAVEIGKDLLDLGKGIKDLRKGGTKGEPLLDLSEIAGLNENGDSKAHNSKEHNSKDQSSKGHSSKGHSSKGQSSKGHSLLPHLLEKADADFDKPAMPSKRFHLSKWIKGIKGNGIVNALTGSAELAEVWNGEGSMKDKVKQSGGVVGSVVGSGLGTWGGAAAGAAIGSVVPVIGTAVGGLIGGVLGSLGGGAVGESLGSTLTSWFTSDDEATSTKANKQGAHGTADSALEKAQGEIKISVEDKRVTVSSVAAHNLNLSIAGSSMGGHQ